MIFRGEMAKYLRVTILIIILKLEAEKYFLLS